MQALTRHALAALWQHTAGGFAALFLEGEMRLPGTQLNHGGALLSAVLNRGLRLATDLPRLLLDPRPGWAIQLNPAGELTLNWPHPQPLLRNAPLTLPTGWRAAAAEHGLVVLFIGESLGLREHTVNHQPDPRKLLRWSAERGELAAGAVSCSCSREGSYQQEKVPRGTGGGRAAPRTTPPA
jgi:hypothetical protein